MLNDDFVKWFQRVYQTQLSVLLFDEESVQTIGQIRRLVDLHVNFCAQDLTSLLV